MDRGQFTSCDIYTSYLSAWFSLGFSPGLPADVHLRRQQVWPTRQELLDSCFGPGPYVGVS